MNVAAFLFGVSAIVDMVWPRSPQDPWYSNYGMLVGTGVVVLSGLLYMTMARPYDRGQTPAGDAHRMHLELARNQEGSHQTTSRPISFA